MLLDRDRRAGRYLEWKVRLFSVAAVLAFAGIYLDSGWMISLAIALLAAGLLLRLLPDESNGAPTGDEE